MIKVLVVDDSILIRKVMSDILSSDPDIEVVGVAHDPYAAREKIKQLNPDVVTLDVEMPRMDGLDFLEKIMRLRPMPVVMISALTQRGADVTLRSLEMGAVDVIAKPTMDGKRDWSDIADEIVKKVKAASRYRPAGRSNTGGKAGPVPKAASQSRRVNQVIAIGASTGGVMALRDILVELPVDTPPILIAQHLPKMFVRTFAARIDGKSKLNVVEATHILPGHVYVSPGDRNLHLVRSGARLCCDIRDPEQGTSITPSVDALFNSVAEVAGPNAIGVILTGMGKDGAKGLMEMRRAGALTIGQSETGCMIYGMPKAAFESGAVESQMSIEGIAAFLGQLGRKADQRLTCATA